MVAEGVKNIHEKILRGVVINLNFNHLKVFLQIETFTPFYVAFNKQKSTL